MWIMLIKCLPILNPPPKYSIFWSTPWPNEEQTGKQKKHIEIAKDLFDYEGPDENDGLYAYTLFGLEPNWSKARAIEYQQQRIRVFPHEFTAQNSPNMDLFINQEQAYDLITDNVAEEQTIKVVLDGEMKPIYESALLDGANHNQALLTVIGMDITTPDADFPPIGYYLLKDQVRELLP
jgi:hypothetical protein